MMSVVFAHDFTFDATNIRTQTYSYSSGALLSTTYSWGNDDHPTYPLTNYVYGGVAHTGTLYKSFVIETSGGTVVDTNYDRKYVYTYYTAYYSGYIVCGI